MRRQGGRKDRVTQLQCPVSNHLPAEEREKSTHSNRTREMVTQDPRRLFMVVVFADTYFSARNWAFYTNSSLIECVVL